jgi:hypothetical protein
MTIHGKSMMLLKPDSPNEENVRWPSDAVASAIASGLMT